MNIEVLISIDGENLPLNEELQGTITGIVNSYIKQKISGVREKKVREPRDPNKPPREARPHLTDEEIQHIFDSAKQLQHETRSKASQIIGETMNRAWGTIYTRLGNLEKAGQLKFKEFDRPMAMPESVNAFKQRHPFGQKQ